MKYYKLILVALLCASLAFVVIACGEDAKTTEASETTGASVTTAAPATTAPAVTTAVENIVEIGEEYQITFAENSDDYVNGVCKYIKEAIKEETDLSLRVSIDWLRKDQAAPEYEIIVGSTNREESAQLAQALKENEWCFSVLGNKVYISGNTARALSDAADYFIDNYVKGKEKIQLPKDVYHAETNEFISIAFSEVDKLKISPGGGYPRLYELADGTLLLGVDGYCSRSTDGGETWGTAVDYRRNHVVRDENGRVYTLSCANSAFFQLEDGTVLVAYRATGYIAPENEIFCTKILVSKSTNGGKSWSAHSEMCNYVDEDGDFKGTWEPHFGLIDGVLTCFYANDSKTAVHPTYQNIEYLQWINGEWTNRTIVSDGIKHKSRDGMPVWQQLSNGKYVCAIEGWYPGTAELCIQLLYSDDGIEWSDPVTVYRAKSGYAGAPYVVELATGQLLIVFQCSDNPDGGENYENNVALTILSDGTPVEYLTEANFSKPDNAFNLVKGEDASWNCLYISSEYLYVASSGVRIKRIPLEELYKGLQIGE